MQTYPFNQNLHLLENCLRFAVSTLLQNNCQSNSVGDALVRLSFEEVSVGLFFLIYLKLLLLLSEM